MVVLFLFVVLLLIIFVLGSIVILRAENRKLLCERVARRTQPVCSHAKLVVVVVIRLGRLDRGTPPCAHNRNRLFDLHFNVFLCVRVRFGIGVGFPFPRQIRVCAIHKLDAPTRRLCEATDARQQLVAVRR